MRSVIEMAREAGFSVKNFKPPVITARHSNGSWISIGENLERFAELVRADEREACAVIAETAADCLQNSTFDGVANAIRARGNA